MIRGRNPIGQFAPWFADMVVMSDNFLNRRSTCIKKDLHPRITAVRQLRLSQRHLQLASVNANQGSRDLSQSRRQVSTVRVISVRNGDEIIDNIQYQLSSRK